MFDTNAPLATNVYSNRIDADVPTSQVTQLPEQSFASFDVHWSGADPEGGSGIDAFEVWVSDDGGPFHVWLTTSSTSAVYTGEEGHRYELL